MAVAAALLAAIVVRIVQSRPPKLEHVTIVRAAAGEYATVQSRIGLYVPSDGMKELQLTGTAPQTTNWITPYPVHPARQAGASEFLAMKQYTLPIVDSTSDEPLSVSMPWRSTMKWLQVRWNGDMPGRVDGRVFLTDDRAIDIGGTLVNATPWDLKEIYLAYHAGAKAGDGSNAGGDRVIYIPKWPKGQTIDLSLLLASDKMLRIGPDSLRRESTPGKGDMVQGGIELVHSDFASEVPPGEGWAGFWYAQDALQANAFALTPVDDSNRGYQLSLPLCSLFDRIPPMRNTRVQDGSYKMTRRQMARVGARFLNVSPALAAGNLVVLAEARGPLPIPFTVEGDTPKGDGVIICQYVLPLGRSARPDVEK